MKVVIIGGAGFIGANAAATFAKMGGRVTVLDNFSRAGSRVNAAWLADTFAGITIAHADVRIDQDTLREHVKDADLILHGAAQVAVTTSVVNPRADFEINALGTLNVLESIRATNCGQVLIFASTNKVYGALERFRVSNVDGRYEFAGNPEGVAETEPLDFHSPYGCSKGSAEQYVRDYARIYGLRTVVFRQSCIYGPRQFGVEDQGWVAWFSICASLRRPVVIYGDGMQVRDVLHVSDLVEAYALAHRNIGAAVGEIYNLGGGPGNTLSVLDLVRSLERRYQRKMDVAFADWRPGDQRVFVANVQKAERYLGWRPKVSPDEGVELLCRWVDGNRALFASEAPVLA